jgi:TPR repeat protein
MSPGKPAAVLEAVESPHRLVPQVVASGFGVAAFLALLVLINFLGACSRPQNGESKAVASSKPMSLEEARQKAGQGDAQAQLALGQMHLDGRKMAVNYTEAARWFRAAAEQGIADAQYFMGMLSEAGRGVTKDDTNALAWFRQAAEQGHVDAQYNLALLYATGRGTPKLKEESVKWFRAAAEQGLADAQFNLAQRHEFGQGTPTNLFEAYKWFSLAAAQGIPDAAASRDRIRPTLSASQVADADHWASAFSARRADPMTNR